MKIKDIEINDRVTFKHGNNLQFVDTGKVFHIEDGILHVELNSDRLDEEVFEVTESELLESYWHRP
tara:strand:- start:485 stop:682 length:198 start_codon:yes stop_codon:yes gene_type:complete